jgi:hypothetical protein
MSFPPGTEGTPVDPASRCRGGDTSVDRLRDGFAARARIGLSFLGHCLRRAFHIERTMAQFVSFDEMLLHMSPLAAHNSMPPEKAPEGWIFRAAEFCACLFPGVWRRRCLFRSLLVLDWARQLGVNPTLNVGVQLGPHRDQGHCWLSIGERPFCEPAGWPARYGILFHRSSNVQYWTRFAPDAPGQEISIADSERRGRGA